MKRKEIKSATIKNNVADGSFSFITLIEEYDVKSKEMMYIIKMRVENKKETEHWTYMYNSYELAFDKFKEKIILATIL